MKALKCEMCDSTDLVKDGDYFVCQNCGTKYTVEAAKKMMIEGTVDVSGSTVKIDNSDQLDNLYTLARRAKEENNTKQAKDYYNQIVVNRPDDWEARFYSTYYNCADIVIAQIPNSAITLANSISNVYEMIEKSALSSEDKNRAFDEVYNSTLNLAIVQFSSAGKSAAAGYVTDASIAHFKNTVSPVIALVMRLAELTIQYQNDNKKAANAYKAIQELILKYGSSKYFPTSWSELVKKRMDIDSEYAEAINKRMEEKKNSSGCYVATAVYGSYDCPEVWTLRRFRDYDLAEKWYGRAFIRTYYAISPTIVKWFGNTNWFKNMWRGTLDKMVSNLQNKGYESTPYNDREW